MMHFTPEQFQALCKKYKLTIVIGADVENALDFACELLCLEAEGIRKQEKYGIREMMRMESAACVLSEVAGDVAELIEKEKEYEPGQF